MISVQIFFLDNFQQERFSSVLPYIFFITFVRLCIVRYMKTVNSNSNTSHESDSQSLYEFRK